MSESGKSRQDLKTAMMMKKKNQFSQTEAVKVVDAATQTEEEGLVEKLRQAENEKSVQTEGVEKTPKHSHSGMSKTMILLMLIRIMVMMMKNTMTLKTTIKMITQMTMIR